MNLVERFCTPPYLPLTEFDQKAIADAERINIPFEDTYLNCYSWGFGKTIVLAHGWGSRASHMTFIAKFLSKHGYRTIAFDAPAHSSISLDGKKDKSNMFEFSRAISTVCKFFDPVHAIIGHSFGAACPVFILAGTKLLKDYKITAEKLIMISSPCDVNGVISSFSRQHNLDSSETEKLKFELQRDYNFRIEDYSVPSAINNVAADVLLIHDVDDTMVPIEEAKKIIESNPKINFFQTQGAGHEKVLANRNVVLRIKDFLLV